MNNQKFRNIVQEQPASDVVHSYKFSLNQVIGLLLVVSFCGLGHKHLDPTESVLLIYVFVQVVSGEKMVSPVVMGLTLHSISMSLDMSMAHMAVQLVFGSGRICNGRLDPTGTVSLILKTVGQVCVLDWWHPRYPHSSNCIRPTHSEEV